MMGIQLLATNVFARRKSLLSRFLEQAETFQSKVRADARSIAMIEAHTIVPLATLGWLKQFLEEPTAPRLSKRDAVANALRQAGLSELNSRITNPGELLNMSISELRSGLVDTLLKTSAALQHFYVTHYSTLNIENWIRDGE